MINNSTKHQPFVYTQLNVITALFQTIQFRIITQFSSIWSIDRTLSVVTTLDQSEPGNDGNEGVLRIPQSTGITEASPSDCLVSYPGNSYSSADWANWTRLFLLYFNEPDGKQSFQSDMT